MNNALNLFDDLTQLPKPIPINPAYTAQDGQTDGRTNNPTQTCKPPKTAAFDSSQPDGIDSKHKSTRESYAADLETIARAFAGQLRTTAEYFLSLLDDTDKAAIQANQPGYLEAWRCAVRLNVQMGLAPRPAPTTNKPAKSVQCQECQHAKPTESPVITECGAGVRSYSYLGEYRRSTQETCFCAKFEPLE